MCRYEPLRLTPSRDGLGGGVMPFIVLRGIVGRVGRSSSVKLRSDPPLSFSLELIDAGDMGP